MFSVTGFSQAKFRYLAIAQVFLCALVIIGSHLLLRIEAGGLYSNLIILSCLAVSAIGGLYYLKREFGKHTSLLRNIINSLTDVVIVKDYEGKYVYCNEAVSSLYQTTPEDMIGKDDFDYTRNREQADFFFENVRSVMDRFETEEVYESTTNTKTGEIRHFQSMKVPFRDAQDQLKALIVAKDITDITNLKEEVDRNRKRLEQVLEVSQEGLWEWNTQTNAVLHNHQWELITGVKRSENTFKEFEECILDEDKPKVHEALGLLLEKNEPYSIEFRMKRPDGKVIWVWDRGKVAEFDEDGNPVWLVGIVQDITAEKHNQEKIVNLAYFDQLTGLVNRAQLEQELQKTADLGAQQEGRTAFSALLFLDLDRFKLLNDSHGHHMGDMLLQAVAKRLSNCVGASDIIARFGGDEFVIFLSDLDESDEQAAALKAEMVAQRVLRSFDQPFQLGDYEHPCSASIGISVFAPGKLGFDELLKQADMAMYDAKGDGRNGICFFDPDMQTAARDRVVLEADLRRDVAAKKLDLHFQPQINSQGRLTGAEVLLRWPHEDRGMVPPSDFIPIAESAGLILPIGDWIFKTACQYLANWAQDPAMSDLVLSVNVSPVQLHNKGFVESVLSAIEATGAPANQLKLEITESMLVRNMDEAIEKMTHLRQHGVRFSLDDFGTGYSCLSYLKLLPLDQLKIDQSFVRDIQDDPNDAAIAEMIVALGKTLGLSVIAEGVETEEQRMLLEELGCHSFQGYLFARPMPMKDFDLFTRSFKGNGHSMESMAQASA